MPAGQCPRGGRRLRSCLIRQRPLPNAAPARLRALRAPQKGAPPAPRAAPGPAGGPHPAAPARPQADDVDIQFATVHVCMNDQGIKTAERVMRFYVDDTTTFQHLIEQAAKALKRAKDTLVLKGAFGAIWPPKDLVQDQMLRDGKGLVLRLTPCAPLIELRDPRCRYVA